MSAHDQGNCTHPDCQFEAEFGYNPADPFAAIRDDEPPDQCSGGCKDGVLPDSLNPGQFVTCDVCWGEGDEERNRQIITDQRHYADLADGQSY